MYILKFRQRVSWVIAEYKIIDARPILQAVWTLQASGKGSHVFMKANAILHSNSLTLKPEGFQYSQKWFKKKENREIFWGYIKLYTERGLIWIFY